MDTTKRLIQLEGDDLYLIVKGDKGAVTIRKRLTNKYGGSDLDYNRHTYKLLKYSCCTISSHPCNFLDNNMPCCCDGRGISREEEIKFFNDSIENGTEGIWDWLEDDYVCLTEDTSPELEVVEAM